MSVVALLEKWGLSALQKKFEEEEIDRDALRCLTPRLVAELVPHPMGLRAKLLSRLHEWRSSLHASDDRDESLGEIERMSITNSDLRNKVSLLFVAKDSCEATFGRSESTKEKQNEGSYYQDLEVREILKSNPEGEIILKHYTRAKKLDKAERNHIVSIVINYCLRHLQRVDNQVMEFWAQRIVDEFPTETVETYYVAPKEEGPRQKISKGKLPDRYRYMQKKKRKACDLSTPRILMKEQRTSQRDVVSALCTSREREKSFISSYQWLKFSREPWSEVIQHWRESSFGRLQSLGSIEANRRINFLLEEWPILRQHPKGYKLIELDYEEKFPNSRNPSYNWKRHRNTVKRLLLERSPDNWFGKILLSLTESTPTSVVDAVLLMGLSYLCLPSNELYVGEKKITPFQERQYGFILYLKDLKEIQMTLEEFNPPQHPFCIFLGENPLCIRYFYVRIGEVLYHVETPLKCVEVCFKAIRILDISYPVKSQNLWYFVQRFLFGVHVPKYRKVPLISSLISDISSEK